MKNTWQEFLKIIHEEVGSRVVETWFKAVQLVRWDSQRKIVYLETPNKFVKEWLKNHYMNLFETHLGRLFNEKEIHIVFSENGSTPDIIPATTSVDHVKQFTPARIVKQPTSIRLPEKLKNRPTNPQYTFDSFVVGPNNQLAFAAAQAICEKRGTLYNPLFIYGDSGLGKTHLLHAIGNHIKDIDKRCSIVYQSADRFIHEFIHAIRFDKIYHFENKYKDIDVLLVDDIQIISHKEQTQEAFFNIFNMLHQNQKQVVFTSDSLPRDIKGLADRIRSRLSSGLVTDIQPPAYETKIAILKQKNEIHGIPLDDTIIEYLAMHIKGTIRELEASLIRLKAFSSFTNESIDLETVQRIFAPSAKNFKDKNQELESIVRYFVKNFNCPLQKLRSNDRDRQTSHIRHMAMYMIKRMTNAPLKDIGTYFNRKDHTTVMHALDKIENQKNTDPDFHKLLNKIEQELS